MNWIKEIPIAHRGLHSNDSNIPENSLFAFQEAINKGFAIELDVRLTKDKQVVVFHDEDLSRMCNSSNKIAELDFNQIALFQLFSSDQKIPLFQEVLDLVDGKVPILIEIKSESPKVGEIEQSTLNTLKNYSGEYAIQSFNPFSVIWFKKNAPHVIRGQLSSSFDDIKMSPLLKILLKNLFFNFVAKPNFIAYEKEGVAKKRLKNLRNKNIPILAWTIRNEGERLKVDSFADNIIFENFLPQN
ncbi:MAG TPA: glycerophosphodiester phosphodiesterase family protein [Leadbetterella sp.]|nr:glycerophosphodiester phosphodiesterase family protein [Leadbetterella sp.]